MIVTLDTPTTISQIESTNYSEPVSELNLIKVEEDYAKNAVFAVVFALEKRFRLMLWSGSELDELNARPEQWTDEDVIARIKEVLS